MRLAVFYVAEGFTLLAAAGGVAWGTAEAADWLSSALWHPVAVAYPAGLAVGLARGRRPLDAVVRLHGWAVQRMG